MNSSKRRGNGRTYLRKNGKIWWIQYSVNGNRYRESSGSEKRADAERLLMKRRVSIAQGKPVGAQVEKTTLGDLSQMLLDHYRANGRKSVMRAQFAFKWLHQYFGAETRANTITQDRVTKYIVHRQAQGRANATINFELSMLRKSLNLAFDAGRVASAPRVKNLHVDNARQGLFEDDEIEAVLKQLPSHLHALIRVAHITGWRTHSELQTRTWKHVDFDNGWLRLEPGEGKTGKPRMFPFLDDLRAVFTAQREYVSKLERALGRIIPWVFVRPDGSPIRDFRSAWKRACIKAGVSGRLVHDLRRTAVRNSERAGVSRFAAMSLTGHKTASVYQRYAIIDSTMLEDAALKLSALRASDKAK
jgi:integrase